MKRLAAAIAIAVAFSTTTAFLVAEDKEDDKPKYTTKQVMKLAHKDKLLNKVVAGDASKEEKEKLAELYAAMAKNEPKKGDAESWKTKTEALVKAAKGVVEGDEGSVPALKKASNCGACHKAHK